MADPSKDLADISPVAGLSEVLLAALEHTRSATCITTAQLDPPGPEIVYVNPAYCAMTGRSRQSVIGATPRVMQGPLTDRSVLDRLRSDLAAGRRFVGETVNYRADGTPFIINWSIDPVIDADGVVTHYVAAQQDVTTEVRSANLLAAEKHVDDALTRILNSSANDAESLQALADDIVAAALMLTSAGAVAAAIDDDEQRTTVSAGRCLEAGVSVEFPYAMPGSFVRGVVEVTGMSADEADFLDRPGLERFACRAGTVVAALAEYQRQRSTALRLQHHLLPKSQLTAPGFTVAARYRPGTDGLNIGGDWYDVAVTDQRIVFSVGDVSGSGIEAAALMGRLRLLADVELHRGESVAAVIEMLDRVCARDEQFATVLFVEFEHHSGATQLWSAGHLPPIRFGASGAWPLETAVAPPLGHVRGRSVHSASFELDVGAGLILFTDGLVERPGEPLDDGLARVAGLATGGRRPEILLDVLCPDGSVASSDDVAVLVLRRDS